MLSSVARILGKTSRRFPRYCAAGSGALRKKAPSEALQMVAR